MHVEKGSLVVTREWLDRHMQLRIWNTHTRSTKKNDYCCFSCRASLLLLLVAHLTTLTTAVDYRKIADGIIFTNRKLSQTEAYASFSVRVCVVRTCVCGVFVC